MIKLNEKMSIGELVANYPQTTTYFIKEGIDFCCGGDRELKEAVKDSNKPLNQIMDEIKDIAAISNKEYKNWTEGSSKEIIDHIIKTHHAFLRETLPMVSELAFKVLYVHGKDNPVLYKVHELFNALRSELERHLIKEEVLLFPAIKDNNKELINELMDEHDAAGDLIKEIKEVTDHYSLPDNACQSYKLYFKKLEEIEIDIYHHVHLENNILFKKLN